MDTNDKISDGNNSDTMGLEGITPSSENSELRPLKRDEKGRLVKGTPPGPGRPKGKTLKEYVREKLQSMSEEEKEDFIKRVAPDMVWKMAEGMPKQETETEHKGEIKISISETLANKYGIDTSTEQDS